MNSIQLKKIYSGKVRDLYELNDTTMLMIASDRISTFDIILNQLIPNKGKYLTQISLFWFDFLKDIMPNHLTNINIADVLSPNELLYAKNRSIIVKKLKPIPIEIIVRGYITGSAFKEYKQTGKICDITLPNNLSNYSKLPFPIFTPSTKAKVGEHDENISLKECANLIGEDLTNEIKTLALQLYNKANDYACSKDIIIADTKFEFGLDDNNVLTLMDEVLTPDSSRFWDKQTYKPNTPPQSYDKQFIRDYLEIKIHWNKQPPIPNLPQEIITKTQEKYQEIMNKLILN